MSEAKTEMGPHSGVRDPRTNPKPGDVLRKGRYERSVVAIHGGDIEYTRHPGTDDRSCWITTWQDWAKDAEVIHHAGE